VSGLNCPKCNARIIHKSLDGKVKIRTSIVAFGPGGTEVVCRKCGADVPIDVHLGDTLTKALDAVPGPRLVVRS
jgi:DNA-directed RNA polymerase subunit RPC12/RpoP